MCVLYELINGQTRQTPLLTSSAKQFITALIAKFDELTNLNSEVG